MAKLAGLVKEKKKENADINKIRKTNGETTDTTEIQWVTREYYEKL